MNLERPQILSVIEYYRPLGFFQAPSDESVEQSAENIMARFIASRDAGATLLYPEVAVLAVDTTRLFICDRNSVGPDNLGYTAFIEGLNKISRGTLELLSVNESWNEGVILDISTSSAANTIRVEPRLEGTLLDLSLIATLNALLRQGAGVFTVLELEGSKFAVVLLSQEEQEQLRTDRGLPIWTAPKLAKRFAENRLDRCPFFRHAIFRRTNSFNPSLGRGLTDLHAILESNGVAKEVCSTLEEFLAYASQSISDTEVGPLAAAALATAPNGPEINLDEIIFCYTKEYRLSPQLMVEPLNFSVSRKVLAPEQVTTILDVVGNGGITTEIKKRGLCEVKILTIGYPPAEGIEYYLWLHGVVTSTIMAHLHTVISESLRLYEEFVSKGKLDFARWPGFNWDSNGERCWIWSESYEFVITLCEYLIAKKVNESLATFLSALPGEDTVEACRNGLDEHLMMTALDRIDFHCQEVKTISNIDEKNLEVHARRYLQDLMQYIVSAVGARG